MHRNPQPSQHSEPDQRMEPYQRTEPDQRPEPSQPSQPPQPSQPQLPASGSLSATGGASPSLILVGNTLYIFYAGSNIDQSVNGIYMAYFNNGQWTAGAQLPSTVNTSAAPAVVLMKDELYVVYKGSTIDTTIWVLKVALASLTSSSTPQWYATHFSDASTDTGPGAYVSNDTLYVFYLGTDNNLYFTSLSGDEVWNPLTYT